MLEDINCMRTIRKHFLEKGLRPPSIRENSKWTNISLRIPKEMIMTIDEIVKDKPGFNRTTWILQALQAELKREERERGMD